MDTQEALESFLGTTRFATYLQAARGSLVEAAELYRWNQQLSGALHAQISYVEIAVRNSLDRALGDWNARQPETAGATNAREWTLEQGAGGLLYEVLGSDLRKARRWATKEADRRAADHPRRGAPATHGDILAQMAFGSWCKLLDEPGSGSGSARQVALWQQATHHAFPHRGPDDADRLAVARRLDRVRTLRNRVAHHENLLGVDVSRRLDDMLSILADIDPRYPDWAMKGSLVRNVADQDPRRGRHLVEGRGDLSVAEAT